MEENKKAGCGLTIIDTIFRIVVIAFIACAVFDLLKHLASIAESLKTIAEKL